MTNAPKSDGQLPSPQPVWMAKAWAELGQHELPGSDDNQRIIELFRAVGHAEVRHDETAWCAAFVGACLERGGKASTRSLLAKSYLEWGDTLPQPRPGCVCVFSRGDDPTQGHVGFWLGEAAGIIVVLGGNQRNAVSVTTMPAARLLGCRWPTAELPTTASGPPVRAVAAPAFDAALAHVVALEGGYSNDPYDPGGPTNQGITLADYAGYRHAPPDGADRQQLIDELKHIPPAVVSDIYLRSYWLPSRAANCRQHSG